MRIKLTLFPIGQKTVLPINYNYFLTSLIYKFIKNSSQDYSSFLHGKGYKLGESKKGFKLFTFSMLKGGKFRVDHGDIVFLGGHIQWEISSPVNAFSSIWLAESFQKGKR